MYKFILGLLIVIILLSGCVDNSENTNSLGGTNLETQQENIETNSDNSSNNPTTDETNNNETETQNQNNEENFITYCIVQTPEFTQKYYFHTNSALLDTRTSNGGWILSKINLENVCGIGLGVPKSCSSISEQGGFNKVAEGWKGLAQITGTCNEIEYNEDILNPSELDVEEISIEQREEELENMGEDILEDWQNSYQ
jgi:hypothetical protein